MHVIFNIIICIISFIVYNNAVVTRRHLRTKHRITRLQNGVQSDKTAEKRQFNNDFIQKQGLPQADRPHILVQLKRPNSAQTQFIKSYAKYAVKALRPFFIQLMLKDTMNAINKLPSPPRVPIQPIANLLPPPPVIINPKLNMTTLTDDSPFESAIDKCVGIQGVNKDEVCLADHIKELVWSKEKNLNTALNRKLHITNENKFIDEVLQLMHADSSDMLETLNPDEQEVCRNTIAQVNGGQKRLLQEMTGNEQVDRDRATGEETMRKLAGITRLPLMSLSDDNDNVHISDLLTLKGKHNKQRRKYHNDTSPQHSYANHYGDNNNNYSGDNNNFNRRRKQIMKLKSIAEFYNLLLQQKRGKKNSSTIADKRDATYWYSHPNTRAQMKRIIQPILKCQNLVFNRPKKMDQEFHKRNGTHFVYSNINTSNKKDEITDENSGDNKSFSENDVAQIITRVKTNKTRHSKKTRVLRNKKDKTQGKQNQGNFKIINISKKHKTTFAKQQKSRRRQKKERQRVKRDLDEIGDQTIELETYLRAYEEGDSLFRSLDNGDFNFNLENDINGHDFDPSDDVTSIISERSPRNSESLDDDLLNTNAHKDDLNSNAHKDTIEKRNYHVDLFLKKSSRPKALGDEVALMRSANSMHDTSEVLRTFNKSIQLLASRSSDISGSGSGEPLYELKNLEEDGGASKAYALKPRFSHNRDKKDSMITRRGLIKRDLLHNSTKLRHNVTIPVFSLPPINNNLNNDDRTKMPIIKNYLHENESMAMLSLDRAEEQASILNTTNITIPVNMALTNGNQIQNVSVQIPLIQTNTVNGDLSAAFLGKLKSTNNNQNTLDLSVKMNNKTSANEDDDVLPIYAIAPRSSPDNESSLYPENTAIEKQSSRAIEPVNKTKNRDNNDLPFTKVTPKPKEEDETKNDDKKKNKKKQSHREKALLSPIHETDDVQVNETTVSELTNTTNENSREVNSLNSDISVGKQFTDSGNVQVLSYTDLKEKDLHSITSATIDARDQLDNLVSISKHKPETLDKLITVTLNPEENHANEHAPVSPVKKSFSSVRANDWTNGTHVITPIETASKFTNSALNSKENDVLKDKSIAIMGAMLPKDTNLTESYKEKSNSSSSSSSNEDSSSKSSAKEDIAPSRIENTTRAEDELKINTDFQDALSFIEKKQGEQLKAEFQDAIHSINFFANTTNSSDNVIDDSLASRTFGDDFASSSPASVLTPLVPNFSPTIPSTTISKEFAANSKNENMVQKTSSPTLLSSSWDRKDVLSNHPQQHTSKNKDDDDDIDQVNHINIYNQTSNSSDTKNVKANPQSSSSASLQKIKESAADVFNVDNNIANNEVAAVTKEPKEEDPEKKDRKRRPMNTRRLLQDSEILSRFANRSLMSPRHSNFTENENGGTKDHIGSTKDSIFPMAPFFPDQPATSSDNLDSLFPYVFSDDNDGKTPKSLGISSVQNLGNNRLSSSTNTLRNGNDPFPNSFIHDAKSADSFDSLFPSDVFSSSTTPGETITPAQSDSKFDLNDYPELQPYISGPTNEKNRKISSVLGGSSPSSSSDTNWNDFTAGTKRKNSNSNNNNKDNNEFNGAAIDALFSSSDTSDPFKSLHRSSSNSLQNNDIFDVPFFHNTTTPALDEPPPLLTSDTFEREINPGNETFFSSPKGGKSVNSAAGFTPSSADSEDLIEPSLTASEIEQALQQPPPSTSLGFFSNESANPDAPYNTYEQPAQKEPPVIEQRDSQKNQTTNNNAVVNGPVQQSTADVPVVSTLPALTNPDNLPNPDNNLPSAENISQPIYGNGQSFATPVNNPPFQVTNRSSAEQETAEAFPPDTAFAKMNTTETDDYLLPNDFPMGDTAVIAPPAPPASSPPQSPPQQVSTTPVETESTNTWIASQQVSNKAPPPPPLPQAPPPPLPPPPPPPPPQQPPVPARLSSEPIEFSATTTEVLPPVPQGARPLTVVPIAPGDTTPVEPPPQIRPQNDTGEPPIAFLPNYQITPLTDLKPDGTITPTVAQTTQGPMKGPAIQYNNITVGLTQDIQNALDSDPELSVTKPTAPHLLGPTIGVGAPSSPPFSFSKGMISATRMCKPGPQRPFYTGKPNCLIIGDSIALSYSVQAALRDDCFVQLSPASKGGVALDSEYGLQCIDMFLSTTDFTPTNFDVIVFNFGLHDIDVLSRFPEEYNNITFYAQNLRRIKQKLLSTGASVAFALSTPVPFDKAKDDMLREYNKAAESIMQETPFVTTVDLYSSVVRECGPVPFESCYMMKRDNDVHYGVVGSIMLGKQIASSIKFLLDKRNREAPKVQPANKYSELDNNSVICPQPFTKCPAQNTCMENSDSRSGHACCPLPNAVDCKDLIHCCPQNTHCHPLCTDMSCSCIPIS